MRTTVLALAFALSVALALALLPEMTCSQKPGGDAAAALDTLQKEYWEWRLREYPEQATWLGDNRYNDRLTDLSAAGVDRRKADTRRMLARAAAIDRTELAGQDILSHALILWLLERDVEGQRYPGEVMLLDHLDGPQLAFPQLAAATPFRQAADYGAYLARLAAYPRYLEQITELLRRGIELRWVQPNGPLGSIPRQIEGQLTDDPARSPFYAPLERFPDGLTGAEGERLRVAARAAIAETVFPALGRFRDFVRDTYLPAGGRPIGASTLPDGRAYYRHAIRLHTTTTLDPDSIHRLGLAEVARIREAMEALVKTVKFRGSFQEFLAFLRADPRFYYTTPEDLLTGYRDIAKRADGELPGLFAELPRNPYGVRPFPDYEAPSQTTARYYAGSEDGSRAGFFMVNLHRLDMRPKYEMEALTLHEAVPGHHLQISRAQELRGLPAFRRNLSLTVFGEGWALYAESLGDAMGFYTDPYAKFGQLTYEMWRACRLVVDTGLHEFGWTRQQAIDFMTQNTAKSEQDIAVEVDRYIVWPGQALAYKIGELKIKELRARAERDLGPRFDVRRFHNALLDNGPLPLDLLEREIVAWIANEKAAT